MPDFINHGLQDRIADRFSIPFFMFLSLDNEKSGKRQIRIARKSALLRRTRKNHNEWPTFAIKSSTTAILFAGFSGAETLSSAFKRNKNHGTTNRMHFLEK
jgi:hypothetical protein